MELLDKKLCDCGCGNFCLTRYISGHNRKGLKFPKELFPNYGMRGKSAPWNKRQRTLEERRKASERVKKEWRLGIKKINPRFKPRAFHTEETRKKISNSKKLNPHIYTIKERLRIGLQHKGKQHAKGYRHTKESREAISKNNAKYWLGKHLSIEAIEKIKEARSKQVFPMVDTYIEQLIHSYLNKMKEPYLKHVYISDIEHKYQCDILLINRKMVIECDGDYWHNYPFGNEIDHIRTKELREKGYLVLRLWEREINQLSYEDFINKLLIFNVVKDK